MLVHGWSASRRSFDPVVPGLLGAGCRVLAYDQRWHGDSNATSKRPGGGDGGDGGEGDDPGACHVARLAVDLEGVLDAVLLGRGGADSGSSSSDDEPLQQVTCVGTSLGAAVLWSHYELFRGGKAKSRGGGGREKDEEAPSTAATTAKTSSKTSPPRIHRVVYVDQAPLQNRTPDWSLGSKGCYDAETLAGLQAAVRAIDGFPGGDKGDDKDKDEKNAFARGNAEACLSMPIPAELDALLARETNRASGEALARLMADHTQGDWRAVVRGLDAQEALVVAGAESSIFPVDGCRWVASNAPRAKCVVFRGCGHWLYIERPDEFAGLVARFAAGGLGGVEGGEI